MPCSDVIANWAACNSIYAELSARHSYLLTWIINEAPVDDRDDQSRDVGHCVEDPGDLGQVSHPILSSCTRRSSLSSI